MDWLNGFFIPIIEIIVILGIVGGFLFILIRAFRKTWKTQTKWFIRYKLLRKKYPEDTVKWILSMIDQGIGYYDTKKLLLVKGISQEKINGIMWIYDQILNTMKGNINLKKNYSQLKPIDFPVFTK
jgi:hypothetical protein